jgi:hypothetical protein
VSEVQAFWIVNSKRRNRANSGNSWNILVKNLTLSVLHSKKKVYGTAGFTHMFKKI